MKKNIFNLKSDEFNKAKRELSKTEYYRCLLLQYLSLVIIVLLFGVTSMVCFSLDSSFSDAAMIIPFYILLSLLILLSAWFLFKRIDMLKEYYELKNEKKD